MSALPPKQNENHSRAFVRSHEITWRRATYAPLSNTLVIAAISCLGACKQPLVVGEYKCPVSSPEAGSPPSKYDPISVPWSSGFENQFCDYPSADEPGWCYGFSPASFRVVSSPVHSGQFAAEFTVLTGTDAGASPQARCARQGVLPAEAYYALGTLSLRLRRLRPTRTTGICSTSKAGIPMQRRYTIFGMCRW